MVCTRLCCQSTRFWTVSVRGQAVDVWQPCIIMSKPEIDSDGFQVVKSKNSTKNKHSKVPKREVSYKKQESEVNAEQTSRRITSAFGDLQDSQYLRKAIKLVSTRLSGRQINEIVCFGLGQISECNISKYQLAFLISLKNHFKPRKVYVHDPIFYQGECEVLKQFGLDVIEQNNEGGHKICDDGITLVYLPHCPKQLTNNFIWSNWSTNLQNCIIIGNSFSSLIDNYPSRLLLDTVPYIYKLHPYTCETVLENSFKHTDIFNDTSIHSFPKENLEKVCVDFWSRGAKPSYNNTEEFITSLMVKKLTI